MKKMKILHLLYESKGDYFGIGGVGIRAYEIYKYLKDRHNITLLCKRYPEAPLNKEIEGLRHIFVGTESKSLAKTLLSYAYNAALFVKRHGCEYDIIIEEFSPAIPTFLNIYKKRAVVLQIQGYTGRFYLRKYNPLYASTLYMLEYLMPRFYNNFIFINEETIKKLMLKDMIEKNNKSLGIIPNGVSEEFLNINPQDGDYILYLGRIDIYSKGLDVLIDAYREFCESFPQIRLVIAGDGREVEYFKTILMRLPEDIRSKIELSGWVLGERKIEIISKALFCVFPSRHEVQAITAMEAMACEKAVIVSDIPEFSYMVQSRAGITFKTGDTLSLAQAMKNLMLNNERMEMGKRGRGFVRDFTWDRIANRFEEFLYRVVNKHACLSSEGRQGGNL